jgi:hypothetical protein
MNLLQFAMAESRQGLSWMAAVLASAWTVRGRAGHRLPVGTD